ncbi:MAG TPA: hypothetical protein VFU37_11330 [Pyrinomonadaceae bacterium]|nr:hypothetical protein [Pyrinomonadaceae bacterium]
MKKSRIYVISLAALVLTLTGSVVTRAESDRTFVSTAGTDSETCGDQTSPCRDFNAALNRTNAGGEVIALDSGIYALTNITITKAVTLTAAPGVHADLYNTTDDNRITVDAGGIVVLRNLYIIGKPGGTNAFGVGVARVGNLQIKTCVIDRFSEGIGEMKTTASDSSFHQSPRSGRKNVT